MSEGTSSELKPTPEANLNNPMPPRPTSPPRLHRSDAVIGAPLPPAEELATDDDFPRVTEAFKAAREHLELFKNTQPATASFWQDRIDTLTQLFYRYMFGEGGRQANHVLEEIRHLTHPEASVTSPLVSTAFRPDPSDSSDHPAAKPEPLELPRLTR